MTIKEAVESLRKEETIQSAFCFTGLLIGIIGTRWHLMIARSAKRWNRRI